MNSSTVCKSDLKGKVESFILDQLPSDKKFLIKSVSAYKLLSANRFDLGFKLIFLKYYKKNKEYATSTYYEDIRSQTLGTFKEFGNELYKNNFNRYVDEFIEIYKAIMSHGFNQEKTIIPLSSSGTLLNGAHRVAASIALNKEVSCVETGIDPMICDYKYFKNRGVPSRVMNAVALQIIEELENPYIAFIWPSTHGKLGSSDIFFPNIIYEKDIELNLNGGFNLICQLYKHMDWIGSEKDGFAGAKIKTSECFPVVSPVRVIVFQEESLEKVRKIKSLVRERFNLEFSSIHITDTKEEAVRIGQLIFNENAVHFLNFSNPWRFSRSRLLIDEFKEYVSSCSIDFNDVVVDGSAVLSLYGLRECSDIDFFCSKDLPNKNQLFESHGDQIDYHGKRVEDILYDNTMHFFYEGLKFVSFEQVFNMKKVRNETKDQVDIALMESMLEGKRYKLRFNELLHQLVYFRILLVKKVLLPFKWVLKKLGLFEEAKRLYKKMSSN